MGNQPEKGAGEFHAGGERAGGHDDRAALDGLRVFQVVRRQAGGLQVGRNRACAPFVSGQYHAGPLVVEHVPQVLFQELRAAAPHRELARGHADERADGRVVTAARKGIQIDRIVRKLPHRVGPIGAVGVQPTAEDALLQIILEVLAPLEGSTAGAVLDFGSLADKQEHVVRPVVEQRGDAAV